MIRLVALLVMFLPIASNGALAQSRQVKGSEFVTIMTGNTLVATNKAGVKFKAFFLSGGMASYEDEAGARDQGKWRIRDDQEVCVTWKKIEDGQERCASVYVNGSELVWKGDNISGEGKLMGGVR